MTEKNSSWNSKTEEVAQHIGEDAKGYKLMHIKQAQQSSTMYNRLTIAGIVLGPMAGILSVINQTLGIQNNAAISIIEILLGFISGIIVAIIKYGKYDEASNANQSAAARYTSIEANVRRQLCLYRSNRIDAKNYLEWLETKYEEILISAPLLSSSIYQQVAKEAAKEGWRIPNQYEHEITINQEYNDKTVISSPKRIISLVGEPPTAKPPLVVEPPLVVVIKRSNSMSKIPEINQYSDKMLEYEMKRMSDN